MGMKYFRNKDTAAVVGPVQDQSAQYLAYQSLRSASDGRPLWEEVGAMQCLQQLAVTIPAQAAGATGTVTTQVPSTVQDGTAISTATVIEVDYYPASSVTGIATNNRTWAVVDTTKSNQSVASLTDNSGTNLTGSQMNPITLANGAVNGGDTLTVTSTPNGTGQADPGGTMIITLLFTPLTEGPSI